MILVEKEHERTAGSPVTIKKKRMKFFLLPYNLQWKKERINSTTIGTRKKVHSLFNSVLTNQWPGSDTIFKLFILYSCYSHNMPGKNVVVITRL